jgi:hypothetical protein
LLAGALALALMGLTSIAQADQPGPRSPESRWDRMTGHHHEPGEAGSWDQMSEMMEQVHGVDADELERHWDEMSEWMDDRSDFGFGADEMNEMMSEFHGPGFGPQMHDGPWGAGHCGAGSPPLG